MAVAKFCCAESARAVAPEAGSTVDASITLGLVTFRKSLLQAADPRRSAAPAEVRVTARRNEDMGIISRIRS
jgi:hypothetical protein